MTVDVGVNVDVTVVEGVDALVDVSVGGGLLVAIGGTVATSTFAPCALAPGEGVAVGVLVAGSDCSAETPVDPLSGVAMAA
ncbi:MAG: hypothetical protein F4047_09145 [Caldilineaceae bacterium SB0670_bin_27]|uniref:Uncharacterized protein n=1 Tax=Caldilineaceae bacterium SB0664_bin_27 TaxID=2605260 RepID=A0A6B0YQV8_9CHLR|nr:hypothetical protein [Caldilineaceae bacterium SB0664_bin_27]MYJ78294.1 hypothetical protein [Caldilineaceae bacterium SB0670_bin_27]